MAKLYFKYGPMKSGKTTDIIKTYYNYREKDMEVIIMKPGQDKKAGEYIINRALSKLKTDYVVGSEENIYMIISQHIMQHNLEIPVLCYGLRADAFSNLFPGSKRLFEISDVIEELKAICKCGDKATFNLRLNKIDGELVPVFSGEQVSIDGIDSEYDSVCRKCYVKLRRKTLNYKDINKNK